MNNFQRHIANVLGNKEKEMNRLEKNEAEGWGMLYASCMILFAYCILWLFNAPINAGIFIVPFSCALYKILRRKYKLQVKFIDIKRFNDTAEWQRVEGRRGEL